MKDLEDDASFLWFLAGDRTQDGPDGLIEDCFEALLREGRALQVFHSNHFFGHGQALQQNSKK